MADSNAGADADAFDWTLYDALREIRTAARAAAAAAVDAQVDAADAPSGRTPDALGAAATIAAARPGPYDKGKGKDGKSSDKGNDANND